MRAVVTFVATTLCGVMWSFTSAAASPEPPIGTSCTIDAHHGTFGGTQGVAVKGRCTNQGANQTGPPTKVIDCGRPSSADNGLWNPQCGAPRVCTAPLPGGGRVPTHAFATLTLRDGAWGEPTAWCPADAQPAVTMQGIREQAIALLPPVAVGAAPKTVTLVNSETVLWATTSPDRDLGTVTVVGRQVRIRVAFAVAHWDFGDDETDTTREPEPAYDGVHNPCRTAQCADYWGHTYRRTGQMTVRLRVSWSAQFSLDGGANWSDLDEPVDGPPATITITVKEARGILTSDPSGH